MGEGEAPVLKKARKEAENYQPKMSKKKVREAENGRCVGGLRQPGQSLGRVCRLGLAGRLVRRVIEDFIGEDPSVLEMVDALGTSKATRTCEKLLEVLRMRLGKALGSEAWGVDMREVVEGRD